MKGSNYTLKLRYERYLELTCKCLSNKIDTKLARMKILYRDITYVYEKGSRDGSVSDP